MATNYLGQQTGGSTYQNPAAGGTAAPTKPPTGGGAYMGPMDRAEAPVGYRNPAVAGTVGFKNTAAQQAWQALLGNRQAPRPVYAPGFVPGQSPATPPQAGPVSPPLPYLTPSSATATPIGASPPPRPPGPSWTQPLTAQQQQQLAMANMPGVSPADKDAEYRRWLASPGARNALGQTYGTPGFVAAAGAPELQRNGQPVNVMPESDIGMQGGGQTSTNRVAPVRGERMPYFEPGNDVTGGGGWVGLPRSANNPLPPTAPSNGAPGTSTVRGDVPIANRTATSQADLPGLGPLRTNPDGTISHGPQPARTASTPQRPAQGAPRDSTNTQSGDRPWTGGGVQPGTNNDMPPGGTRAAPPPAPPPAPVFTPQTAGRRALAGGFGGPSGQSQLFYAPGQTSGQKYYDAGGGQFLPWPPTPYANNPSTGMPYGAQGSVAQNDPAAAAQDAARRQQALAQSQANVRAQSAGQPPINTGNGWWDPAAFRYLTPAEVNSRGLSTYHNPAA